MNKLFLLLLCVFVACEHSSSAVKSKEMRLEEIREKVKVLKEQIRLFEIQALNDEIEGQGAMRSNYGRFADEMQSSERNEQHAQLLEKQLKVLLQEKEQLEKSL